MNNSALDRAIELMREAQQLLDSEHPVVAAHLETVIGLAVDRHADMTAERRAIG